VVSSENGAGCTGCLNGFLNIKVVQHCPVRPSFWLPCDTVVHCEYSTPHLSVGFQVAQRVKSSVSAGSGTATLVIATIVAPYVPMLEAHDR